ncbi:MAG: Mor transcription activator family protein [Rhodoferax sp.]
MKFSEFIPIDLDRASTQQLEIVNAVFEQKAPDVWRDIAELNFVALRDNKALEAMPDQLLADMAVCLVYQLISSMGGSAVYLPNGWASMLREKNALIAKEFRGNNIRALSKKHRVSETRIRQIVNEQADLKKAESRQNGGK